MDSLSLPSVGLPGRRLAQMMIGGVIVGSALVLLCPRHAWAGDTYCVGGRGVCNTSWVQRQHGAWHFHCYVTDGSKCYECYDEEDNTCESTFLSQHPSWRSINRLECRAIGIAGSHEGVQFYQVDGEEVTSTPPPPPPRDVALTVEVVKGGGGPYAIGDDVSFSATVVDQDGNPRDHGRGEFALTLNGQEVARVPADIQRGGHASGSFKIPKGLSGKLDVSYVPTDVDLGPNEQLDPSADRQRGQTVDIVACRYRATVAGDPGTVWLSGTTVPVSGTLVDFKGQAVANDELKTLAAKFELALDDGSVTTAGASVEDGAFTAQLNLPKLTAEQVDVVLTLGSTYAGGAICPANRLPVVVTTLQAVMTATVTKPCYVSKTCQAHFKLKTPPGDIGQVARDLLAKSQLTVTATVNGQPVSHAGSPFSGITVTRVPQRAGQLFFDVRVAGGGKDIRGKATVNVNDALQLSLPDVLDFGAITGPMPRSERCKMLDFSQSNGVIGQTLELLVKSVPTDCQGEPVALYGRALNPLVPNEVGTRLQLIIDKSRAVPICIMTPRCPNSWDSDEILLRINSKVAEFPDEFALVRLRFSIEGRSFFSCWRDYIGILVAVVAVLIILYGFKCPRAFEMNDKVRVARDRNRLKRASDRRIVELPGGQWSWYCSAAVHMSGDGQAIGIRRGAALTLEPGTYGGVRLRTKRAVKAEDRQTRQMVDEQAEAGVCELRSGKTYQVGDLFLRIS